MSRLHPTVEQESNGEDRTPVLVWPASIPICRPSKPLVCAGWSGDVLWQRRQGVRVDDILPLEKLLLRGSPKGRMCDIVGLQRSASRLDVYNILCPAHEGD